MTVGFPNLSRSPARAARRCCRTWSVSIEQHVDWIADCLDAPARRSGFDAIEPTAAAEAGWVQHVNDCRRHHALSRRPTRGTWAPTCPASRACSCPTSAASTSTAAICDEVVERRLPRLRARPAPTASQCNDGVDPPRCSPTSAMVLEHDGDARICRRSSRCRPTTPGRSWRRRPRRARRDRMSARSSTACCPAPPATSQYRLYRPAGRGSASRSSSTSTAAAGCSASHDSDDPFCRDLCVQSDAVIVSVDYRHAPEDRFPAAADDGVRRGRSGSPTTPSSSAASPASSRCAAGAPAATSPPSPASWHATPAARQIVGQVLLTPVTDCDLTRGSYVENADGYVLTPALMQWFWDHYADPADRARPAGRAAAGGRPRPACRRRSSSPASSTRCATRARPTPPRWRGGGAGEAPSVRGHIHTSLTAVDMLVRRPRAAEMGAALRGFFSAGASA